MFKYKEATSATQNQEQPAIVSGWDMTFLLTTKTQELLMKTLENILKKADVQEVS